MCQTTDGGEHIQGANHSMGDLTLICHSRHTHDQRHPHSTLIQGVLPTLERSIVGIGHQGSAIVTHHDNRRAFFQT